MVYLRSIGSNLNLAKQKNSCKKAKRFFELFVRRQPSQRLAKHGTSYNLHVQLYVYNLGVMLSQFAAHPDGLGLRPACPLGRIVLCVNKLVSGVTLNQRGVILN